MASIGGSGKGIQIVVGADYNDRDLKRAQRDLDQLKAKAAQTASPMSKLGNTLKANVGPALAMAGAAAAAFAVKLAVDGVQAAAEEEKQLAVLKQTLDNVGQGFAMDSATKFIDDLRFMSGVSDSELIPSFQKLVGATKDVSSAQELLRVSVDASIGSGKELGSVSQAVAKAVAGSSTALKKLIPELDATAIKGGGAEKVIAALEARFGGSAQAAAKTFAGQLQRLQDGFGELTESFGKGFLGALDDSKTGMNDMAQTLRDLQPSAEQLGQTMGQVTVAVSGLSQVIEIGKTAWSWVPGWLQEVVTIANSTLNPIAGLVDLLAQIGIASGNSAAAEQAHADWLERNRDNYSTTTKAGLLMTEMLNESTPAVYALGDASASSSESILLLREDIRLTTASLGPLAAAFDEANAAMDRRQSMQDYRDALKAYIEDPSKETMAGVESAMIGAAESFTDPTKQAKFTKQAIDEIATAAKNAGQNVPPEFQTINSAAAIALDPVAKLKQTMEEIPTDITSKITVDYEWPDGRPPGGWPKEWYGAKGGAVPRYMAVGGGSRGSDTVPAMLAPGEFIISAPMVKKWGASVFSQLNAGFNPLDGMSTATGRRGGGLTINGGINVMAAPGESAEQSLPRALRRMSFLAGI